LSIPERFIMSWLEGIHGNGLCTMRMIPSPRTTQGSSGMAAIETENCLRLGTFGRKCHSKECHKSTADPRGPFQSVSRFWLGKVFYFAVRSCLACAS
jgi:hypothetical protein